jgi:hypothetical protein
MITLDGIELPADLEWVDEYSWSPVQQNIKTTLTGALVIPEMAQLAGREMTLEGDETVWITKAVLEQLRIKANTANLTMVMAYHGIDYNVKFHRQQPPISARLIVPFQNPQPDDVYSLTLRLMHV